MSNHDTGWYPDPLDAGRERYWDGSAWTEETRPGTGTKAAPAQVLAPTIDRPPLIESEPEPVVEGDVHPVPGWQLLVLTAALSLMTLFVPTVSSAGQSFYAFKDDLGEWNWSGMWPVVLANGLLIAAALSARLGRTGWYSIAAGTVMVASALNFATTAFLLELVIGFQEAGFGADVSPHVGAFTSIAAGVVAVIVVVVAVRGALARTRGTLPPLLSAALAAASAWVFVVLASEYFSNDVPLWNSDFFWLNVVTAAVFVPLAITAVLPLIARNSDAAGLTAGYAFPLAAVFIVAVAADDSSGAIGVTDGAGVGIAILVMFAAGVLGATMWGRRLVRELSSGRVIDVHAPQQSVAIAAVVVAGAALVFSLAQGEDDAFGGEGDFSSGELASDDGFDFESEDSVDYGSSGGEVFYESGYVSGGDSQSHWFYPSYSGYFTVSVSAGFDATLQVYVDGSDAGYNDDFGGSTDPSLSFNAEQGTAVELIIDAYGDGGSGEYSVLISG